MSIYNMLSENQIDIQTRKLKAGELWVKDEITGEYVKITSGGGGGGGDGDPNPYYLKANSIKIDDSMTSGYTQVDTNSIDVMDVAGNRFSTMHAGGVEISDTTLENMTVLTKDKLSFANPSGIHELGATGVEVANKLHTGISSTVVDTNDPAFIPILYNETTGEFKRAARFRIGEHTSNTKLNGSNIIVGYSAANTTIDNTGVTNTFNTNNIMKTVGSTIELYSRQSPFNKTLIGENTVTIGTAVSSSNKNFNTNNAMMTLFSTSLAFKEPGAGGATHTLNKDSIQTANKLRDITSGVMTNDHRMVLVNPLDDSYIYNEIAPQWEVAENLRTRSLVTPSASTRLITHDVNNNGIGFMNIPATVDVPAYLGDNEINMAAADGQQTIKFHCWDNQSSAIKINNIGGSGPANIKLSVDGLFFHPPGPTTTNDVLFDSSDAKWIKSQRARTVYFYNALEGSTISIDGPAAVWNPPVKEFQTLQVGDKLVMKCNEFKYNKRYCVRLSSSRDAVITATVAPAPEGVGPNYDKGGSVSVELLLASVALNATEVNGAPGTYQLQTGSTIFTLRNSNKAPPDESYCTCYVIFEKLANTYTDLTPIIPSGGLMEGSTSPPDPEVMMLTSTPEVQPDLVLASEPEDDYQMVDPVEPVEQEPEEFVTKEIPDYFKAV